jgi:methyl-accepting chemotaxis protein
LQTVDKAAKAAAHAFSQREKDDLGIYGDIMIVCEKVSDGYLDERITFETQNPQLKYIAKTLNAMFDKLEDVITDILQISREYGSRDFDRRLDSADFKGDIARLIQGINALGNQLADIRQSNFSSASDLTRRAAQLEQIVSKLQDSAAQQASNLEETAAASTQLGSGIDGVRQKVALMQNDNGDIVQAITQGKEQITKAQQYIKDMAYATDLINEATTDLDAIAVQTDILSLNASVEAANAGKEGKGFTIVAQEVGSLAKRSTEVVNRVKQITADSLLASKQGQQQLDHAADYIFKMQEKIYGSEESTDAVSSITAEQSNGVTQIETALHALEELSNTNLELSSDTTDVSKNVSALAKRLQENI